MKLEDPCGRRVPTLDSTGEDHLLVHGQGGVSLIDQCVGAAPSHIMLYSYSTVYDRERCSLGKLDYFDFGGPGVLIPSACLHTERGGLPC